MKREQLEHIISAAANVTGEDEFVVIGSQSILGTHRDAPAAMLLSMEADIYPAHAPHKSIEIDGSLGDGSQFHLTFGYYAHGVGPETVTAPAGWTERLVRVPIRPRLLSERKPVAHFLEVNDLVLSKCAAGRQRDWEFAQAAIAGQLASLDELTARLPLLPIADQTREHIRAMLAATAEQNQRPPS